MAQAPRCPWTCYLPTPFGNCTGDGQSTGTPYNCAYPLMMNNSHRVAIPVNAVINPGAAEASTCWSNVASETPAQYTENLGFHHSHHGFFHSSSTTIHWYYHMHVFLLRLSCAIACLTLSACISLPFGG